MWNKLKKWLGRGDASATPAGAAEDPMARATGVGLQPPRPDLSKQAPRWIEAADNPWQVRVLDVRPMTLGSLSMSSDPQMASNAVSYGGETGTSFASEEPSVDRAVAGSLRFRAPSKIADGALFIPREMEDKWALFVAGGALIVVRGWQRRVFLRATLQPQDGFVDVCQVRGAIWNADEPAEYTLQALDFLLRTHALRQPWPAPLLHSDSLSPEQLAMQCMSGFGRQASYAYVQAPPRDIPTRPLRTMSALHLAAMHNDLAAAHAALASGVPVDQPDPFGASPLQYVVEPGPLLDLLVDRGADVNLAADDGTTPLMAATQNRQPALVNALLVLHAHADDVDVRGFSALHRAAEMGQADIINHLLAHGADPDRKAAGEHTPRTLARGRGHEALLSSAPKRPS